MFNWRKVSVIFVSWAISGLSNRKRVYSRIMGGLCVCVYRGQKKPADLCTSFH